MLVNGTLIIVPVPHAACQRPDHKIVEVSKVKHNFRTANNTSMQTVAKGPVILDISNERIFYHRVLSTRKVIFTKDKCEVLDDNDQIASQWS